MIQGLDCLRAKFYDESRRDWCITITTVQPGQVPRSTLQVAANGLSD